MGALNRLSTGIGDIYSYYTLSYDKIEMYTKVINVSKSNSLHNSSASKGNQRKWRVGNRFVKLDLLGYESISEIICSFVLKYVYDISSYVLYYPCIIVEDSIELGVGCYSDSFLDEGCIELPISKILESELLPFTISYDDVIELLYRKYNYNFSKYMDDLLFLDILTRNDDRHFYNISLVQNRDGSVTNSPIFDNGSAFFSDLISYPIDISLEDCFKACQSKPFNIFFEHPNKFVTKYCLSKNIFNCLERGTNKYFNRCVDVLNRTLNDTRGVLWEY